LIVVWIISQEKYERDKTFRFIFNLELKSKKMRARKICQKKWLKFDAKLGFRTLSELNRLMCVNKCWNTRNCSYVWESSMRYKFIFYNLLQTEICCSKRIFFFLPFCYSTGTLTVQINGLYTVKFAFYLRARVFWCKL
jgi:hypothetical protein